MPANGYGGPLGPRPGAAKRANKLNTTGLGRSLVKNAKSSKGANQSDRYTTETSNEPGWVKLQSQTQSRPIDEFLSTAELADTDFTTERTTNIRIIQSGGQQVENPFLLSKEQKDKLVKKHYENAGKLTVPRRPQWNKDMTAHELDRLEKEAFLNWRRSLADLQENQDLLLTPFERNIEVWRQLWRVVERSDLVVQIVDARNPLLYRSIDLDNYVKEIDDRKRTLLLVNKADMLSESQRQSWAEYFTSQGIRFTFFSAKESLTEQEAFIDEEDDDKDEDEEAEDENDDDEDDEEDHVEAEDDEQVEESEQAEEVAEVEEPETDSAEIAAQAAEIESLETEVSRIESEISIALKDIEEASDDEEMEEADDRLLELEESLEETLSKLEALRDTAAKRGAGVIPAGHQTLEANTTNVLSVDQLEALFITNSPPPANGKQLQIGLVGYPNVGKSSTINALIGAKKVSVSSTPGKTKHFQTIQLSPEVMLADCPGLVFPNFAQTSGDLVTNGVLPIDQLREYLSPVELVCQRVPKYFLEAVYGIHIYVKPADEGGSGVPTAVELLNSYARARSYWRTGGGDPDISRASRYILKDYVNGKLLYCEAPPTFEGEDFNAHKYNLDSLSEQRRQQLLEAIRSAHGGKQLKASEVDLAKEMQQLKFSSFDSTGTTNSARSRSRFAPETAGSELDREFFTDKAGGSISQLPFHLQKQQEASTKKHFKKGRGKARRAGK